MLELGALAIRVATVSGRVQARYSAAKSGGKTSTIVSFSTQTSITWNGPRLQVTQCQPARSAIYFTLPASVATLSAKCVAPKPRPSGDFLTKLPPSSPAGCNSVPAG